MQSYGAVGARRWWRTTPPPPQVATGAREGAGLAPPTARTRATASPSTRASRHHLPAGSVSSPAARCGGTRPAGAGSGGAAAARRWPSSRDARRGMPLEVPGAEEPAAAAVDRAAPLFPGLARVVQAEQGVRLNLADLHARDADQHREQALNLAEGPGEGPAERTVRPHSAPPMLELVFENDSRCRVGMSRVAPTPSQVGLMAATAPNR
jgi:hypothetical protein